MFVSVTRAEDNSAVVGAFSCFFVCARAFGLPVWMALVNARGVRRVACAWELCARVVSVPVVD